MPSSAQQITRDAIHAAIREYLYPINVWNKVIVFSPVAHQLLMLTAAVESDFLYTSQRGGPAITPFQIEPATFFDVYKYMRKSSRWRSIITGDLKLGSVAIEPQYYVPVARAIYWRYPEPLPEQDDWKGLAAYWKTVWNTSAGKGTIKKALAAVERHGLRDLLYG